MSPPTSRRARVALAVPLLALAAAVGCQGQGFSVLGYHVGGDALYDSNIKTVYVPVFVNRAFQTTPHRGLEVEMTRAVVREIGRTTRFKVVSDPERADTELKAVIGDITKGITNRNPQNATREAEITVTVDVIWRDLRDGRILNAPRKLADPTTGIPTAPLPPPAVPFDPDVPLPPRPGEDAFAAPTRIVVVGRLIPELGETNVSAQKRVTDQVAIQIVALMEKPW